jgi:hypothetical protein
MTHTASPRSELATRCPGRPPNEGPIDLVIPLRSGQAGSCVILRQNLEIFCDQLRRCARWLLVAELSSSFRGDPSMHFQSVILNAVSVVAALWALTGLRASRRPWPNNKKNCPTG